MTPRQQEMLQQKTVSEAKRLPYSKNKRTTKPEQVESSSSSSSRKKTRTKVPAAASAAPAAASAVTTKEKKRKLSETSLSPASKKFLRTLTTNSSSSGAGIINEYEPIPGHILQSITPPSTPKPSLAATMPPSPASAGVFFGYSQIKNSSPPRAVRSTSWPQSLLSDDMLFESPNSGTLQTTPQGSQRTLHTTPNIFSSDFFRFDNFPPLLPLPILNFGGTQTNNSDFLSQMHLLNPPQVSNTPLFPHTSAEQKMILSMPQLMRGSDFFDVYYDGLEYKTDIWIQGSKTTITTETDLQAALKREISLLQLIQDHWTDNETSQFYQSQVWNFRHNVEVTINSSTRMQTLTDKCKIVAQLLRN